MLKILSTIVALSLSLLVFSCAQAIEPEMLGKLKRGDTSSQVKEILGKPMSEDKNPDGRYVYVYEWQDKVNPSKQGYATLLFGRDSKFLQLQTFEKTDRK